MGELGESHCVRGEFRTACSRGVMLRIRGVSRFAFEGSFALRAKGEFIEEKQT